MRLQWPSVSLSYHFRWLSQPYTVGLVFLALEPCAGEPGVGPGPLGPPGVSPAETSLPMLTATCRCRTGLFHVFTLLPVSRWLFCVPPVVGLLFSQTSGESQ